MLARRAHSRAEIERKLKNNGLPDDEVAEALHRLEAHGLVDDARLAREWVEERRDRRGREALVTELEAKGIEQEAIESALQGVDEEAAARALALRLWPKVAGKPPHRQAAALYAMVVRRGFSPEMAEAAARAVLPPEGWD